MAICKGCGREIIWAMNETGSRVPLEECKHAYVGINADRPTPGTTFDVVRPPDVVYISHFLTCARASDFSKSKKSAPESAAEPVE